MFDVCNNLIVSDTISVVVQVTFVFTFLVIFYFLYVIKVEQDDFKEQINLIVDNLILDVKDEISSLIVDKGTEKIKKEDMEVLIYGIIDTIEEKNTISSKEMVETINSNNNKLKNNIYKILIFILIGVFILLVLFRCLPIYTITKESLITVFFIAITELVFLTFISGKYISADPNKIKNILGTTIKKWIKDNKFKN
jgi:VIT1/CCC1 family predicted Fe2+/Mn2+ transporter